MTGPVREKNVESHLTRKVKDRGGLAWKWVSPGNRGVPDRILMAPGGRLIFAEVKAPGNKPTPLQAKRHEQLRALGFEVVVIDSNADVDSVLRRLFDGS